MRYFDTSYLVRCYLEDPGWEMVRALAEEEPVACSALGQAEAAAAFHRKLREGSLTEEEYHEVAEQFLDDCTAGLWQWLPIGDLSLPKLQQDIGHSRRESSFAVRMRCTWSAPPSTGLRKFSRTTGTFFPPLPTLV